MEIPEEPRSYCGMDLKKAVRMYCHEEVIEKFLIKPSNQRSFHKPSRCGANLRERCCFHRNKCDMPTFVAFCPYRYIRR